MINNGPHFTKPCLCLEVQQLEKMYDDDGSNRVGAILILPLDFFEVLYDTIRSLLSSNSRDAFHHFLLDLRLPLGQKWRCETSSYIPRRYLRLR